MSPEQHGFLKRRSTCTNLLESLNDGLSVSSCVFRLQLCILLLPKLSHHRLSQTACMLALWHMWQTLS